LLRLPLLLLVMELRGCGAAVRDDFKAG